MSKPVTEAHELLYHYTTAAGLKGIIESQQLRATNISYLNDAEEHTGFFDRRLPHILELPIRAFIEEIAKTTSGKNDIDKYGGFEKAVDEEIKNLVNIFRDTTLKLNEPYVTAFCSEQELHGGRSRRATAGKAPAVVCGFDEVIILELSAQANLFAS